MRRGVIRIPAIPPRRAVTALHVLLVSALVLALLLLARDAVKFFFSAPGAEDAAPKGEARVQGRPGAEPLMSYAPILSNNVFGFPAGKLSPLSASRAKVAAEKARPKAASNLKLLGTVAWPGGFGYAIVSGQSGTQEVFRTGQHVPGAGRLLRVGTNEIVIDEGGGAETRVPLAEVSPMAAAKTLKMPGKMPAQPPPSRHTAAPPRQDFARQTGENTYVVDKEAIDASLANPKHVLTDARLLPHVVDGVQDGFIISEVRSGGIYDNLGLRNGDVLSAVNNLKLSDPEVALQAFTALRGLDKVELDVVRGGEKMTLTYTIR
jgi:general secretion pathway protein C